jgi:hypothetical protein
MEQYRKYRQKIHDLIELDYLGGKPYFDRFVFTTDDDAFAVRASSSSSCFAVMRLSSQSTDQEPRLSDDPHTRREFYEFLMARDISGVDLAATRPRIS